MRWQDLSGSSNVEDRRGQRSASRGVPLRGVSGLILFFAVIVAGYYGIDLTPLVNDQVITTSSQTSTLPPAEEQEMAQFTSVALKTTEQTWGSIFRQMGANYKPPRLVMYTGGTTTGCGFGQSAMGPFYCPQDETVYIDLSFYRDLKTKMGGGGDFAQGYVLAHEVGHHIQHLLGVDEQVKRLQARASKRDANQLSVRMELQADCYAGIWGKAMEGAGILDPGDLEKALRTAQAIGDDRIQKQSIGRVIPDSFTHGTSAQRLYWFKRGFESGDIKMCNTFTDPQ